MFCKVLLLILLGFSTVTPKAVCLPTIIESRELSRILNVYFLAPKSILAACFGSTPDLAERHTFRLCQNRMCYTNCHQLVNFVDHDKTIEIEDGSCWEISESDADILRNWTREDFLIITPSYSWFSSYDYFITNKTSGTSVKANISHVPAAFGPYSHWIADIDYFGGHIQLENQTTWCVDPQDSSLIKNWAVNDHIIIGLYDSWFSSNDHILINANADEHIRARQY